MGLAYIMLTLKNPRRDDVAPITAEALADSGSTLMTIPESVAEALHLEANGRTDVVVADGRSRSVPYVGPIEVRFKDRYAYVGALVMGDQVLLGAVPMEDMNLVVLPRERRVDVAPGSTGTVHRQ